MRDGIHIVERAMLPQLAARGLEVPEPWLGVLDLCRMIEGQLPEPRARQALGVMGLDALLLGLGAEARACLQPVRRVLLEGRRYFHWKQIPLVFLVEGQLSGSEGLDPLTLSTGEQRWELTFLFGSQLKPTLADLKSWWWSPQLG